jgi:cysteine-rich repeat protein
MTRRIGRAAAILATVLVSVAATTHAATFSVCTAGEIFTRDPSCPASTGPCNISQTFIVGDGCTLNFGTRAVTVLSTGEFRILTNTVTINAGSFTVAPGGFVNVRGDGDPPSDFGGALSIFTTGAFTVERSSGANGRVDGSARTLGGTISVDAGGPITIQGRLTSDFLTINAAGGTITLRSDTDVLVAAASTLSAAGGAHGVGGSIDIFAGGRAQIDDTLEVQGGEGGYLGVDAGGEVLLDRVSANANGDAGTGGTVIITAGTNVQTRDFALVRGSSAADGTFGGDGGIVDLTALYGDVTIGADFNAEGASPDGTGGSVTILAAGSFVIPTLIPLSVRGNGSGSSGGDLYVEVGLDATFGGTIDASGGSSGGNVDVTARRNITFTRRMDASGRDSGGYGGFVFVIAGSDGRGSVFVDEKLDAGGGGCSLLNGCGGGGAIDLFGCDITVSALGEVQAGGPSGGAISLNVNELLTVNGLVNALHTSSTQGTPGATSLQHPTRRPPVIGPGLITPTPDVFALATCTGSGQLNCIDPCPACGDGTVTFPETCDQLGTPVGCDGCSSFCRLENCNDLNGCTVDSCTPTLGCRHVIAPDGTSCSDGLVCNGSEVCTGALCRPGAPLVCDDTLVCTLDSCTEPSGCTFVPAPSTVPCNDGNACTVNDQCNGAGQCAGGGPRVCTDGQECTNDGCIPTSGCVFTPRTGPCTDEGNQCTNDVCNLGVCTHPLRANGTPCDDGLFCTLADGCVAGVCVAAQMRSCADTSSCTADTCDELIDMCVHTPAASCCGNGAVEAPEECDDGNQVDTDACLTTCQDATCGDGIVWAGVEQCDAGAGNSNAPGATCRTDCRPARCGDGIIDPLRGEQCDDANAAAGDGCSATCFIEPPSTAAPIGGKGSTSTDCILEWKMDRPGLDRNGRPDVKQTCRDNDPTCDFDPAPEVCVFHVWSCANVQDPNLPACTPASPSLGTPSSVAVVKPSPGDAVKRVEDAANRAMLLSTVPAVQTTALNACGPRLSVRVPFKKPGRPGNKALKVRAITPRNIADADQLKLFCVP